MRNWLRSAQQIRILHKPCTIAGNIIEISVQIGDIAC